MKAMIIDRYGKVPMRMAEVPTPEINEYEVLAEIHAASITQLILKYATEK